MIKLDQLDEMFSDLRANTDLAMDGDLLWGYFFTDPSEVRLQGASETLVEAGYRVVSICPCEGEDYFWLHVERVETHTPESLHRRNAQLESFAEQHRLRSYDGMDVGPIPPT